MDPFSITLTVVSLTTAVKDLVELGQKIHESFAKASKNPVFRIGFRALGLSVSKNLRNAQRVAETIKEMVDEIKVFCEDYKDALVNMKDFCVALTGLLSKFQSFERSVLPLLPKSGQGALGFFLRGWLNNNKIQECILDLEGEIVKVMRKYMIKSAMRTEAKLETIHRATSSHLTDVHNDITQGLEALEVVRRDISALRITAGATTMTHDSYDSSGRTHNGFDRNLIMFAQSTPSTSAPILRTPNVITDELVTTAYIKFQVNTIVIALQRISTLPAPAPNNVSRFQLALILEHTSMSITHLRHHVVRQVTKISDLLEAERGGMQTVSIQEGGSALTELAVGLQELGMGHESILIGKWAITLARILVDASSGEHPDHAAALALCLVNQSLRYHIGDDKIQSLQAVKEAYTIIRNLRKQYKGEAHFQILASNALLQYAKLLHNQTAIEMSIEAVKVLENILSVQAFTQSESDGRIERVLPPSPSFLDRLFSRAPIGIIMAYEHALQSLGTYLLTDDYPQCALDLALLAISVRRNMVSVHGHEYRAHLADALARLVQGGSASSIPVDELVNLAEECLQLLRELAGKNPLSYARRLANVLYVKARTLGSLNRGIEAIATWEELASLAGQIIQDTKLCAAALGNLSDQFQRLQRHNEAAQTLTLAITSHHDGDDVQAARYFNLSRDLRQLGRFTKSVEAARTSVTLYQRLAAGHYLKWMGDLTTALSNLALCLLASDDFSAALIAWRNSVSMLDVFLNRRTGTCASAIAINMCLVTLDHPLITYSHISADKEECLAVCFTAVRYLHRLSAIYPRNGNIILSLLWAEFCYVYNMLRLGRLQDAQQHIGHWLDVWSRKPEATSDFRIARWYAAMSILEANVLDAQGYTEQALLAVEIVRGIVWPHISTYQPSFQEMVNSMVTMAQLQLNLGNSEVALQIAEEALQLSRVNTLEPTIGGVVPSLHAVAFTALSCRNYTRAAEVAQEGCNIYANLNWRIKWEHNIFIRPSLLAILSSAEANLGGFSSALEDAHRAVDLSLDIGNMKSDISATTARHSYMETRGNLADILLATGDLTQAQQICEERRSYFSKRVEKRMGDYRKLAPVLHMLGVMCCSEGRHEEGNAAAQDLSQIMKTLGHAFPSLQEQVKIRLRHQALIPIRKVLEDMSQKLECKHQAEVVSLFAI